MKKAFIAVIGLVLVFAFVLSCDFTPPVQKADPDDDWPTGYPSEEIRYDENGKPMKELAIQVGGGSTSGARGLDTEVAQLCINWFEVEIIAGTKVYSASGPAHENLPQTSTTLHLWLPYDMPQVTVGDWRGEVMCYGGYRRRTADGSIDYTLLALGQCYKMTKWMRTYAEPQGAPPEYILQTETTAIFNTIDDVEKLEELYFRMTALEFDINTRNDPNFRDALEASTSDTPQMGPGRLLPHGGFWIQNPRGWSTLENNNFHTYTTVDGTVVPYFELPPGRSLSTWDHAIANPFGNNPWSADVNIYYGPANNCVGRCWIQGILKPEISQPPNPLTDDEFITYAQNPLILTTDEDVAKGFVVTSDMTHNYTGWQGGTGFFVGIQTGVKGWAMISPQIALTTNGGTTWLVRNGMYLWVPDTGIANGSLGGGILIRVCDKNEPLTATPLYDTTNPNNLRALGNILPEQYMPPTGWEPLGWAANGAGNTTPPWPFPIAGHGPYN